MIAMVGFWGICLFAVFSAGGPIQLSRGILFILAGGLMLAIPPRTTLPPIFWFLGGCFLILSSLCLLPAEWFTPQLWRLALREEGLDTGPRVTAHPGQSLEQLVALAVTVVTGLYILSQKVSGRAGPVISLLFPAGVAVYAIVSILAIEQEWTLAWDPVPGLGFFPNRNHTATLLAMGTLTSVASLFQSIKSKNGVSAGLAALAVVVCIWALIGYNLSRAGLLLTLIGLLTAVPSASS